jgi:molybdate transport system substrate-binding protein
MRPIWAFIAALLVCVTASAQSLRVSAAISLRDALDAIKTAYQTDTKQTVEYVYGSSGELMTQIKTGSPVDVFISAANTQVDDLTKGELVLTETRRVVARNTLVLIVPADAKDPPSDFNGLNDAKVARLAIGEPKSVPAGQYAVQVLTKLDLAEKLKSKMVYGANVRQVLGYVELGEVSAGIVYSTDAKQSGPEVKVVAAAPENTHEPIVYPGVVIKASKNPDAARQFLDYLGSDKAKAILTDKGFSTGPSSGKTPSK